MALYWEKLLGKVTSQKLTGFPENDLIFWESIKNASGFLEKSFDKDEKKMRVPKLKSVNLENPPKKT